MPLWIKITLSAIVMQVLGGLGAVVTTSEIPTWYAKLNQPPGNPPNWLFGPVWACLYAMIGAAVALVWHRAKPGAIRRVALTWFVVQLALNLVWTPVFFGMHQLFAGLIIIILLWGAIAVTIWKFKPLSSLAAALLVPYLAWVSFASYLNLGYWWLNR